MLRHISWTQQFHTWTLTETLPRSQEIHSECVGQVDIFAPTVAPTGSRVMHTRRITRELPFQTPATHFWRRNRSLETQNGSYFSLFANWFGFWNFKSLYVNEWSWRGYLMPLSVRKVAWFQCISRRVKLARGPWRSELSKIFKHLLSWERCPQSCSSDCFEILDSAPTKFQLKLKEAMHINWEKPNLNQQVHHVNLTLTL